MKADLKDDEANRQRDKCQGLIDAVKEHEKAVREAAHDPAQDGAASKTPGEAYYLLARDTGHSGHYHYGPRAFSAMSAQSWMAGSHLCDQFEARCPELKR